MKSARTAKNKTPRAEGRPPKYQTPVELQVKIEKYFKDGVRFKTIIVGPANNRTESIIKVPTICGLCLYLGFESRQSFYDYEKKDGFAYTVKKARMMIEREYEEQLQTGTPTGAIFALKNFDWKDTPLIDQSQHTHTTFIQNILDKAGLNGQPAVNPSTPEVKSRLN